MQSNKIFPFERNRFYCGKLLTSSDFEEEQRYFNNKRNFLSKMLFGSGIVSGFKTYAVDDTTLMIESGVALDSYGREVVLEKSQVKKLSTIDGFGDIKSSRVKLYVEYSEEEASPMYALVKNAEGKDYENNRIVEKTRFFIKDADETEEALDADARFVELKTVYEDENFRLSLKMPKTACIGASFRVVALLKKLSGADIEFSGEFFLQIPGFVSQQGESQVGFSFSKVKLNQHKSLKCSQVINAERELVTGKTTFVVKKDTAKFLSDGEKRGLGENVFITVEVKDAEPEEVVKEQITQRSMDQIMAEAGAPICIAELEIVKEGAATCVISNVARPRSYGEICVPAHQEAAARLLSYYEAGKQEEFVVKTEEKQRVAEPMGNAALASAFNSAISSGSFDIPLGSEVKVGKTVFSDEIMHGLGAGEVFVEVGIEYILKNQNESITRKIVYGDNSIFAGSLPVSIATQHAVQVLCEKGTFMLGVRFLEPINISSMKVRWFAFKMPEFIAGAEMDEKNEGRAIFVKKNNLVVEPNEIVCLDVDFEGMQATALKYEVVDKNGGTVDANGMYSAPNKEGVYEVKISCVNEPEIYTYAYVIVIKKDA